MKKMIYRIISVILFVLAAVAVVEIFTVKGTGFIDFSNLAKMLFGVIAVLCVSLSVVLWKTEDNKYRKVKGIFWIVSVLIIAFAVFGSNLYKRPATEMITSGTITFYSEPTKEFSEPTGKKTFDLTEEQAVRLQNVIGNVEEWVDDHSVDRLAYYFDGYYELGGIEPKYYFTYEYNVIYYDHFFAEIAEEDMQYIRGLLNKELKSVLKEAESIEVAFLVYSSEKKRELTKDEIVSIVEWFDGLEWSDVPLNEDETPGNYAGGEQWGFNINGGEKSFIYAFYGSSAIYIDGNWYQIKNPTKPPLPLEVQ